MKGEIRTSVSAITAAVMLVACASKGPVSSAGLASTGSGAQSATSSEYQRLIDNASKQQLFCRREVVPGSRIGSQVCLTQAQMDQERQQADELVRDIRARDTINRQRIPDRPPMPMPTIPRGTP